MFSRSIIAAFSLESILVGSVVSVQLTVVPTALSKTIQLPEIIVKTQPIDFDLITYSILEYKKINNLTTKRTKHKF